MKGKDKGITYIIGIPERDNIENEGEKICKDIMPKSFPEWI